LAQVEEDPTTQEEEDPTTQEDLTTQEVPTTDGDVDAFEMRGRQYVSNVNLLGPSLYV